MNVKLVATPIFHSDILDKDIYVHSECWNGKKDTIDGSIYGFFEKKKEKLNNRGITNFNFLYYNHSQFKTEEIVNGNPDTNYFMIRWGVENLDEKRN